MLMVLFFRLGIGQDLFGQQVASAECQQRQQQHRLAQHSLMVSRWWPMVAMVMSTLGQF